MPFHSFALSLAALAAGVSIAACSAPPAAAELPAPSPPAAAHPPATMTVSALPSGSTQSSAAMAYEGGRGDDKRTFVAGAILVDHPKGRLLFDAGYGRDLVQHFKTAPKIMQMSVKPQLDRPVAEQLEAGGVPLSSLKAIVLTHAHWDHVSGLGDMPATPVWVTRAEMDFIKSGDDGARLARDLGTRTYRTYDFPDGAYLGFARSWDVFDDGSVVLVPAPGHTPGSIVAFVNTPDGRHYALIGDTAWQVEGVDLPAQKPMLTRFVDEDPAATLAMLQRLHAAKRAVPGLIVVPAHDARVWAKIPRFGSGSAAK
ncbi:MAG: MBL fold metallo-hydrolase [Phenylobacterium sp.]|uniref:MBL fold metallo-hydrolase n=1 Tax=Phenylobacterium sp. TaxID=1871053 RepID=UPI00121DEE99|nr:MBL fold metallo-hydrolase [Phenylobacterium sp.]TAJ74549.1 MAG: MBL fold metallo-hydrolase [Phenylobacterium sp.]